MEQLLESEEVRTEKEGGLPSRYGDYGYTRYFPHSAFQISVIGSAR